MNNPLIPIFIIGLVALPIIGLFMGLYTDNPAWFLLCLLILFLMG